MTGDGTLADVTRKPGANTRFPAKTTPLLQRCDSGWPQEAATSLST